MSTNINIFKMISFEVRSKLLILIRDRMIPEYENLKTCKEEIKKEYIEYLENDFLTKQDRELLSKYPDHIKRSNTLSIISYYSSEVKLEPFSSYCLRIYEEDKLNIKFDTELPVICDSVYDLKKDEVAWSKIGPSFYRYINFRNNFVKKMNLANRFLEHKNTTITLIKNEFPELYKLYKGC